MSTAHQLSECTAYLALRRRMAWGLTAGRTKQQVAEAEGLTLEDCAAILATPGIFMLMNAWALFLHKREQIGQQNLVGLVRWAMDFISRHAEERAAAPATGLVTIIGVFLRWVGTGLVRSLCRHIDEVSGRSGTTRRPLRGIRKKMLEAMAWGIEVAIIEKICARYGQAQLVALDESFRRRVAAGEAPAILWNVDPATEDNGAHVGAGASSTEPYSPAPRVTSRPCPRSAAAPDLPRAAALATVLPFDIDRLRRRSRSMPARASPDERLRAA